MFKKVVILCGLLLFKVSSGYSQADTRTDNITHTWKEVRMIGIQLGVINSDNSSSFVGIHGIYNSSLIHKPATYLPRISHIHVSSFGAMLTTNYFSGADGRFSLSAMPTTGAYLNNLTLMQFGAGLTYDSLYGYGVSLVVLLSSGFDYQIVGKEDTFASAYIQFDTIGGENKIYFGFALSVGSLMTVYE